MSATATCSRETVALALRNCSGSDVMNNDTFRGILSHFLHTHAVDRMVGDGHVLGSNSILAVIAGEATRAGYGDFAAQREVITPARAAFKKCKIKLIYRKAKYRRRQCGTYALIGLDPELLESVRQDRENPLPLTERVFFMTGEPWSKERAAELLAEENEQKAILRAAREKKFDKKPTADRIIAYHQERTDPVMQELILILMREIQGELLAQPASHQRTNQLRLIKAFIDNPCFSLKLVANSDRPYPDGPGLVLMAKTLKRRLWALLGAVEFDLVAAQVACLATTWKIPKIQRFFARGGDWWAELLKGCSLEAKYKDILKRATYGIAYSETMSTTMAEIRQMFWDNGLDPDLVDSTIAKFFQHSMIQALVKARDKFKADITERGYAVTVLGVKLRVTEKRPAHKVAAACAHAMEQAIVSAIYEVAETTTDFTIIQYMYDGVAIIFHRNRRRWEWEISRAVNRRARQLKVHTRIQISYDGAPAPLPSTLAVTQPKQEEGRRRYIKEEDRIRKALEIVPSFEHFLGTFLPDPIDFEVGNFMWMCGYVANRTRAGPYLRVGWCG